MLENKENNAVPNVNFPLRRNDEWFNLSSNEIFKDKTVIIFSLPGAFTPTCSSSHLPRYNELYDSFKLLGIDDIYCLSVNDTFVMNSWLSDQGISNIKAIPDGTGEFTDKMGMLVDKSDLGFGKRSWRYSMLVENGIIRKMFIEDDLPGDPFEVSDADTMINYLDPEFKEVPSISIFSKPGCSFCTKAKDLLNKKELKFEEIVLGSDATITSLKAITGNQTAPQIFIGGKHVGGYSELKEFLS